MEVEKCTVRSHKSRMTKVWLTLVSPLFDRKVVRFATHIDEVEALLMALTMAAKAVTGWQIDCSSDRLVSWKGGLYQVRIDLIKDKGKCGKVLFGSGQAQNSSLMQAIIDAFIAAINDILVQL